MPWKESKTMSERMKFVLRYADGEKMTDLCREFDISRKTGYKLWKRYQELGVEAFLDQSRRPKRFANATKPYVEKLILDLKYKRNTWGAPKILEYLKRHNPEISFPARSTVHAILERNGLVKKRGRRRYKSSGTNLKPSKAANDLWCVDYKGQFRLGNKRYCYPLTITDHYSRFILCCESLESTKSEEAIPVFNRVFKEYGMPHAIRSDNGAPFASPSYYGLSSLSVLWLKLGIKIERIKPGNPQENGRHERMHRTLKAETTKPPSANHIQQQEQFDSFMSVFNYERPHEALEMKTPSQFYKKSSLQYQSQELDYSHCDRTYRVASNGQIEPKKGYRIHIGKSFSSQTVGITEIDDGLWKISFNKYDIAFYDFYDKKIEKIQILDKLANQ